jgi:hypothetical protein
MPVSAQSGKYLARGGKTRSCQMACCQLAIRVMATRRQAPAVEMVICPALGVTQGRIVFR